MTYICFKLSQQTRGLPGIDAAARNKNERIDLRVKSSAKRPIERAASFEGKTVSHFILTSALEKAEKTIQKHDSMTLNAKNSRTFFEALAAPIRFNRKLGVSDQIAIYAMVVDAIVDKTEGFHKQFGFIRLREIFVDFFCLLNP